MTTDKHQNSHQGDLPSSLKICRVIDESLRWKVPCNWLNFNSTDELKGKANIIGQDTAKQALMFGIQCSAYGQNVYVRGGNGTGRMTMVKQLFEELKPKARVRFDRCYVHNFSQPDKPKLLSLPAGSAKSFKAKIRQLSHYIEKGLEDDLNSDDLLSKRTEIQEKSQQKVLAMRAPIEAAMEKASLALVAIKSGNNTQQAIFPVVDGNPIAPDELLKLIQEGKVEEAVKTRFDSNVPEFQRQLQSLNREISKLLESANDAIKALNESETRNVLKAKTATIVDLYCNGASSHYQHPKEECEKIQSYIDEIIQDVIDTRINGQVNGQGKNEKLAYDVNVLVEHTENDLASIVYELTPNLVNLLGTVEMSWNTDGSKQLNYQSVHAGSLLRADGGYLVIDVNDLINENGAWNALKRTLRSGRLEIVPAEASLLGNPNILKPEAIKIDVRVILIGDVNAYYLLDRNDSDFSELFKVLADFDNEISRDEHGVQQYAKVLANIIHQENLAPFTRDAIACVIEHGARVIAKQEKLTAKFSRVADIMREANFVAHERNGSIGCRVENSKKELLEVIADDVIEAIKRTKARASLPSIKFQNLVNNGTINIQTEGDVIGQINGLAVIRSGAITYGFPSRITSTIGPGKAGLINIEGQSSMSGSIHTKGFHIIGGLLRHLIKTDHPLAFSASIAFEQSYGGIDGDSASGAETVCLLSALTQIPIKQSIAMTGAIDQHGRIQAIGGVNEKIEGFYDACAFNGLTGTQGVIIPLANSGDLMLRQDVVDACCRGEFSIYAVDNIYQALEVATQTNAGNHEYTEGSLMAIAKEKLKEYWKNSERNP